MTFGYFDDASSEYVITTPKTPLPWINYLGCRDFFSLISNTCGGYSFYKDAKLLRLTRYRYNGVPHDGSGKYYYIKEGDQLWNPGWQPTQTPLDRYECRHGLGYSRFLAAKGGLKAELLAFVPLEEACEVDQLTLTNETDREKRFQVFSYVEFCLWNALDDMTNFQRNLSTGEVEVEGSAIYHKTEYRERRNHYALFWVNAPIQGFDTSRDAFLGRYSGAGRPEAVVAGQCRGSMTDGWYPIAAHQLDIRLKPGESRDLIFVLGYVENPADQKWASPGVIRKDSAHRLLSRFQTAPQVQKALADLRSYWQDLLCACHVSSRNDKVDRMVNIWNPYQCMVTFNLSRSASYFESGIGRGMGFRDSCQDLLGFVHLIPGRARQRILDIASTQLPDGSAYHQYQPLTKKGNSEIGSGFHDDPLWLIAAVAAYLKETGDLTILDEPVPFDSDPAAAVPLFEHLTRSFHFTVSHKGPHGLPLIGRADWNDCLNLNCFSDTPEESFQTAGPSEGPVAESVFIAAMFVKYGQDYARICRLRHEPEKEREALEQVKKMNEAVLASGWDGEWFLRAYDADSRKVGSRENEEGQIYIEPQGFCVLAGIGVKEGLAEKALRSVKERLDTDYGIMILQPAYTHYYPGLGEISSYPPGYKENAGIFCHNNPWISIAETVCGHGRRAFEVYRKTCPAYTERFSEIHATEPYAYCQMVAGRDARLFGQGKNSWLTGTAAWSFVSISQYLLGVRPEYEGLVIDPCLPADFGDFHITRRFRGAVYEIDVQNPHHVEKGIRSLTVEGRLIPGNLIPLAKEGSVCRVIAVMG